MNESARWKWLRADARLGKKEVLKLIDVWIDTYINDLQTDIKTKLTELSEYVVVTNKELKRDFTYDILFQSLHILNNFRFRTKRTNEMFGLIINKVQLLKRIGIPVEQATVQQLEDIPIAWAKLKRASYNVKDSLQSVFIAKRRRTKEERKEGKCKKRRTQEEEGKSDERKEYKYINNTQK
ncbi:MAG: hypothetical protein EZS28_019352 [Streblomastix strix]|uniref:Uncharacterized protein n=1 Tax=Streblomastix strix TaxID=222440 RepID=A0A5J4VRT7_9EUKA|nr:MAG: hypothetical protein EZS28_019352 [Streblomastix strix]